MQILCILLFWFGFLWFSLFFYFDIDYNDFYEDEDDSFDDSMDGDADSAFESCGWGSDESYGYYGDDTPLGEEYYGGEWWFKMGLTFILPRKKKMNK